MLASNLRERDPRSSGRNKNDDDKERLIIYWGRKDNREGTGRSVACTCGSHMAKIVNYWW